MQKAIAEADKSIQWFHKAMFEPPNPPWVGRGVSKANELRWRLVNIKRIRPSLRQILLRMDVHQRADDLKGIADFREHILDWWYLQSLLPLYTEP
jgi:hypothetical protein